MKASKAIQMQFTSATKRHYTYVPPPEGDPVTEIIKRGRKSSDRWTSEIATAEKIAPKPKGAGRRV